MAETISDRARELFVTARTKTAKGVRQIMAEHASRGLLNSGPTIKRLVDMHYAVSQDALKTSLEYIERRVESRGSKWRRMISDVCRELDAHLLEAEKILLNALAINVTNGPKLAEKKLAEVRTKLHRDLEDYREGWTGAPGKPWSERHKVLYTFLAALGGAAAAKLVEFAFALRWIP